MTISHDHLHSTTDKAVSLEEDYRKISVSMLDRFVKAIGKKLEISFK